MSRQNIFAIFSLIMFIVSQAQSQIEFSPKQVISVDTDELFQVFVADLNGDSIPDVISTSDGDNKIAWYENQCEMGFGDQIIVNDTVTRPYSIFAIDLDGDGDIDILSGTSGNTKISWYANDGSGNFSAPKRINSNSAHFVYASDIDNDGDNDIIANKPAHDQVVWYSNDGFGNFGSEQIIGSFADGINDPRFIDVADFDMNGYQDVVVSCSQSNNVVLFLNDSLNTFSTVKIITSVADYAWGICTFDAENDGDIDIVSIAYNDNKIAWFENDGDGNFSNEKILSEGIVDGAWMVVAADLDVDGRDDIVVSASDAPIGTNSIHWFKNLGSGEFDTIRTFSNEVYRPWSLFAIDLDNDGDDDLVTGSILGDEVAWFENLFYNCNCEDSIITIVDSFQIGAFYTLANDSVVTEAGEYLIMGSDKKGCDQVFQYILSTFIVTGNLELNSHDDYYLYPNPASEYIILKLSNNLSNVGSLQLKIFDLGGKIVQSERILIDSNHIYIDVQRLDRGIYVLAVQLEGDISKNYSRLLLLH